MSVANPTTPSIQNKNLVALKSRAKHCLDVQSKIQELSSQAFLEDKIDRNDLALLNSMTHSLQDIFLLSNLLGDAVTQKKR